MSRSLSQWTAQGTFKHPLLNAPLIRCPAGPHSNLASDDPQTSPYFLHTLQILLLIVLFFFAETSSYFKVGTAILRKPASKR